MKKAKNSPYPGHEFEETRKTPKKKPSIAPYEFTPIGVVRTGFAEKFGIPRQPGMVRGAKGVIELTNHPFLTQACRTLEEFSHLWIVFVFHAHGARDWKPSIRPPRLGGRKKVGVLASRSPHRPNPIGLSVVEIERVEVDPKNGVRIYVLGVDLLDGTPVLDIKPYIPFADSVPHANPGWAAEPIEKHTVSFSPSSLEDIERENRRMDRDDIDLKSVIIEMLELDPRPASQKRKMPAHDETSLGLDFAFTLFDVDVKWTIRENGFLVTGVEPLVNGRPRGLKKRTQKEE